MKDTPVLNKIRASIHEFRYWSPKKWEAVTEARCAPGTCATIMHEFLYEDRTMPLMEDDKTEWICGGQKTHVRIEGIPLFMDVFYQEGTLAFNGSRGPLSVSSIPFLTL